MAAENALPPVAPAPARARSQSSDAAEAVAAVGADVDASNPRKSDPGSSAGSCASGSKRGSRRGRRKSERTPLLINTTAKPEEEVYPLPWFRSPEWTRKTPVQLDPRRNRRRPGGAAGSPTRTRSWLCCFGDGGVADSESDLEIGYLVRDGTAATAGEADGFKQCIQFLVGLIVLVAVALILLIIFQTKTPPPPPKQ